MASAAHAHPTGLTDICETFWNDFEHNLARRRYGFDISEAFVSSCAHETIVLEAVRNSKQSKAQRCRKLDVRFVSVDAVTTDTFFLPSEAVRESRIGALHCTRFEHHRTLRYHDAYAASVLGRRNAGSPAGVSAGEQRSPWFLHKYKHILTGRTAAQAQSVESTLAASRVGQQLAKLTVFAARRLAFLRA